MDAVNKALSNHVSALIGTTFSIDANYPPFYASYLDIEGKSLSFLYKGTLGDIKVGPYAGGKSDVNVVSHGFSGSISAQLFKFEGVHFVRKSKPKEFCCNE